MTLKEIGQKINLSRERVRQIESEALNKLYYILMRYRRKLEEEALAAKEEREKEHRNEISYQSS